MNRLLPAAALLLGCTPDAAPPAPEATASPPAGQATVEGNAAPRSAAAAAPVAPVTPGALKTFRDWAVGCDNTLTCTMASLGAEGAEFPTVTLALARKAGPDGSYTITIDATGEESAAPAAMTIDGARFPVSGSKLVGVPAARIATALGQGRGLTVTGANGTTLGTVSLAGAAAALRYVDAQQGRVGTRTATVATGNTPASAVPAASTLPVIAALTPTGTGAAPTATQLAAMRKQAGCETGDGDMFRPESHALGGGKTLVLLPCSMGAYNVSAALFVLADGTAKAAQIDVPTGFSDDSPIPSVVNGSFENGILSSYAKGRGLGDCGVAQSFVWDGARVRLIEQSETGECRGNPNYITTWRTRVERK